MSSTIEPNNAIKRVVGTVREYVTHWVLAGAIIALTGFAPEHWFANAFHYLSLPEGLLRWWPAGFDFRVLIVLVGMSLIAGDVLVRSHAQQNAARREDQRLAADSTIAADAPAALFDKPSIAVLPFANISDDPQQEYFADGMAEDIITGLSRIKSLVVIARNSSFVYKGKAIDVKQIGRELGVRYVLEGSVRKAEKQVRITAKLIDARSGGQLWAERFDQPIGDIFALQDEIAMSVTGAIEPNVLKVEIERVKRKRPENLQAYDLVLQALPYVYTGMADKAEPAIALLERALELEPGYPHAHALLAWCYHYRFSRGGLQEENRRTAIRHAHAALTSGSDDATTLAIVGFIIWIDEHDTAAAFDVFDRALALSEINVVALCTSAVALSWMGKNELAIERAKRALRLSPFDLLNYLTYNALAVAAFNERRYEDARDAARHAVDSNPHFSVPHLHLTAALVQLGHLDDAKEEAKRALALHPAFTIRKYSVTVGLVPAVFEPIAECWRKAGLPE